MMLVVFLHPGLMFRCWLRLQVFRHIPVAMTRNMTPGADVLVFVAVVSGDAKGTVYDCSYA